jgi:hypothetical protein
LYARENSKAYLCECGVRDEAEENRNQKTDIAFRVAEIDSLPPQFGLLDAALRVLCCSKN